LTLQLCVSDSIKQEKISLEETDLNLMSQCSDA
jgi:hypothetical protein